MKKSFKKVAPAPASSVPPAPPAPPKTKIELLEGLWKRERERQEAVLQDFRDSMKPDEDGNYNSIAYHLEWKAEAVFAAEAFLYSEMRGMDVLLAERAEDLAFIQERLEAKCAEIIQDLTGGRFGGGGQGPWRHNSSGALANVNNMAKCDAKREAFRVMQNMLEVLAE